MLTFFRRIRNEMLSTGATRKYLIYAIGEIVLVVIGILIALQINNWNENRKNDIVEKDLLTRVYNELVKDTLMLSEKINFEIGKTEDFNNFINHMYDIQSTPDDYFELWTNVSWSVDELILHDNTYSEIVSSGTFILINDPIVKERIIDYYKSYQLASSRMAEMNMFSLDLIRGVYPRIMKGMNRDLYSNKKMYTRKDWEFINDPDSDTFKGLESSLQYFGFKSNMSIGLYLNMQKKATDLLIVIKNELKIN